MAEPLTHKFRIGDMVRITRRPEVGIPTIGDVTIGGSFRVLGARADLWRPGRIAYFLSGVLELVPEDWLESAEGKDG